MNRNPQTRMANDEIRRNTEIRMTNGTLHTRAPFDIRALDFLRHLSFVIRHWRTGSWSRRQGARRRRLSPNRSAEHQFGMCLAGVAQATRPFRRATRPTERERYRM